MSEHVDVAIIGAGTAGMGAYREVGRLGKSVRLIERGPYGTTCARVGCMPSKLLIAAAEAAHMIAIAPEFGVHAGPAKIDGEAVMRRVRAERDRFVGFVLEAVEGFAAEDRIVGEARFKDDHTLEIDGHGTLKADRIVIATGSSPAFPPPWRETLGDLLIVNDDVFEWRDLPSSIAVFGGGVIGLELAQALHRLGVRVRLFGKGGAVGPLTDPEVHMVALDVMKRELPFLPDVDTDITREGDQAVVRFMEDGAAKEERFDLVLAATGRRPNVAGLGLENTSARLDVRGLPAFDRYTSQLEGAPHIFIGGDVNGEVPLLHEAADEGKIAGYNAAYFPDIRERPRRTPLSVVFSDPQIAMAGKTYKQLVDAKVDFDVGSVGFAGQGRSRVMLKNKGVLHVYGECHTGRFLGAEMIGPAAEHIGHLLAWAIERRATVQEMIDSPFYHPVVEEGVRTALRDLRNKLRMGAKAPEHCLDCGPGG